MLKLVHTADWHLGRDVPQLPGGRRAEALAARAWRCSTASSSPPTATPSMPCSALAISSTSRTRRPSGGNEAAARLRKRLAARGRSSCCRATMTR